jgi:SAM-dependent methyltransferase
MGKYSQAYFDNPEVWSKEAWRQREGDRERARLAAEWFPGDVCSVLDVGCGNGVYTDLPEPNRFKVGLDMSRAALQNLRAPRLLADASRLPFDDGSFDAILSMEMLEHLPEDVYQGVLSELKRVARKYILITVPYNERLKYNTVICPSCGKIFHPYHHLRQYQVKDIKTLFGSEVQLTRFTSLVPVRREALPFLWNMIRVYQHRHGKNFPNKVVCPRCGYTSGGGSAEGKEINRSGKVSASIKQLWPMHTTYTWWMALYRKDLIQ